MNNALHEMRRKTEQAERTLRRFRKTKAIPSSRSNNLRIVPLGGQDGIGEKNMIVVEYGNDALVLDCGFALGIDLPGVNYAIPVTDYLETIRHKLRGYVISHGHLDHIGALAHVVPKFPAPILGSNFTIGMVKMHREYHKQIALKEGIAAKNTVMANNGDVVEVGKDVRVTGRVASGSLLVDKTGSVVPELVTRDRLLLQDSGFVTITVLLGKNGRPISSLDIITRGHIAIRENEALMQRLRADIRKHAIVKNTSRQVVDTLKERLRQIMQTPTV